MKKHLTKILFIVFALATAVLFSTGCTKTHIHNYVKTVIEPTCMNEGYTINECFCGKTFNSDTTPVVQHSFINYVSLNNATCVKDATEVGKCKYDGCTKTNKRKIANSALGHVFTEYVSDNNATFYNDGTKTAICERTNCNKTHTVVDAGTKLTKRVVTLIYNNGNRSRTFNVADGTTFSTPTDPVKENYIFTGWYTSALLKNKYDFSSIITSDLTLYAGYEINALALTNTISTDTIKSIVKIYNKSYNDFLGIETSSASSQGSGFCFAINNGYYYVLTNCHVAKKISGYDNQEFIIEDYQGKTYEGYLYKNPNKGANAISATYDLACLYFKTYNTNVKKLSFANNNALIDDDVINLGAPEGQSNSITFGKILSYSKITLNNTPKSESNVTFNVIRSNAYANNGSSGGALLNSKLEVVGVLYAGNRTTQMSYAIPLLKIKEFLNLFVYN